MNSGDLAVYDVPHHDLGTCPDCYTWRGPRGSAHDPPACPFLGSTIDGLRVEIRERTQRLDSLLRTQGKDR